SQLLALDVCLRDAFS
ncbi:DUF645 family protein, partial [Vibrio cholerae]